MKKIVLILLAALMTSCACLMSQNIPPQTLYVDSTCGAALPDYRPLLTFTDNCGIDTVEQTPTPGSWLTTRYNTVDVRAIDNFGNYTDVLFEVQLIDTVPPQLSEVDSSLAINTFNSAMNLYDTADRLLAHYEWYFDDTFPWDDVEFQYVDSLGVTQTLAGIPWELQPTNLYCNYTMVSYTPECYAFSGEGNRVFTFMKPGDTITIPLPPEGE